MSQHLKVRMSDHINKLRNGWHHSKELQADFLKYGEDKFKVEVLRYTNDYKSAALAECEFIMKANKKTPPYNFSGKKSGDTVKDASKGITTTSVAFKWDILEALKDKSEEIDRSVSWIVNRLSEKFLDGEIDIKLTEPK